MPHMRARSGSSAPAAVSTALRCGPARRGVQMENYSAASADGSAASTVAAGLEPSSTG